MAHVAYKFVVWTDTIWLLWSENWPLRSDICLQRIVSVVGSTAIFFAFQKIFAIIWGKKRAGAQSTSSLRSFWNWVFVLTTGTALTHLLLSGQLFKT
jgi:hypothetical protein